MEEFATEWAFSVGYHEGEGLWYITLPGQDELVSRDKRDLIPILIDRLAGIFSIDSQLLVPKATPDCRKFRKNSFVRKKMSEVSTKR